MPSGERPPEHGDEAAREVRPGALPLDGDEERAKRFNEAYERLIEERRSGIKGLWSADDLSSFVARSQAAFPKAISAIALLPGQEGQSHSILTLESDIKSLLN